MPKSVRYELLLIMTAMDSNTDLVGAIIDMDSALNELRNITAMVYGSVTGSGAQEAGELTALLEETYIRVRNEAEKLTGKRKIKDTEEYRNALNEVQNLTSNLNAAAEKNWAAIRQPSVVRNLGANIASRLTVLQQITSTLPGDPKRIEPIRNLIFKMQEARGNILKSAESGNWNSAETELQNLSSQVLKIEEKLNKVSVENNKDLETLRKLEQVDLEIQNMGYHVSEMRKRILSMYSVGALGSLNEETVRAGQIYTEARRILDAYKDKEPGLNEHDLQVAESDLERTKGILQNLLKTEDNLKKIDNLALETLDDITLLLIEKETLGIDTENQQQERNTLEKVASVKHNPRWLLDRVNELGQQLRVTPASESYGFSDDLDSLLTGLEDIETPEQGNDTQDVESSLDDLLNGLDTPAEENYDFQEAEDDLLQLLDTHSNEDKEAASSFTDIVDEDDTLSITQLLDPATYQDKKDKVHVKPTETPAVVEKSDISDFSSFGFEEEENNTYVEPPPTIPEVEELPENIDSVKPNTKPAEPAEPAAMSDTQKERMAEARRKATERAAKKELEELQRSLAGLAGSLKKEDTPNLAKPTENHGDALGNAIESLGEELG